eukprot:CAMPEP_0118689228 /NCGR_PEP_ID=MMETSP0800-20121206/9369_1 /TAXON_ID=210618 ORGANISM="Striatella unipunctata, Strain CCMP2910" /NCGR_SAMPLE_ID=MMETSP0800 /ASSEMBLY_ACC=CAM_ASM_000638 /LENGTH=629 /DNA_ID=CAMNT_0006586595 /DNA_START=57 /DNA_END=1947 /DNA_ORIENTATION=+
MADEARAKRAAALEEKKRRLEELKEDDPIGEMVLPALPLSHPGNLDEYIDGLLKVPPPEGSSGERPSIAEIAKPSQTVTDNSVKKLPTEQVAATPTEPAAVAPPPKKTETFTIATQTEEDELTPVGDGEEETTEKVANDEPANVAEEEKAEAPQEPETPKALTAEEREATVASEPFSDFLNSASKKVERMLGAPDLADLLADTDYLGDGATEIEKVTDGSGFITGRHIYECPKWTATRDVTDVDWSPIHRELMLASYHMPSTSKSLVGSSALSAILPKDTPSASLIPRSGELQSDGLALVWSLAMPNRPEHIFTCGSPVLTSRFHPTEHHLLVGGCHSGQLVVWDIRAGRLAVQRSSLDAVASKGHSHPICSMEITEGGAGLVTGSSDGKLNFWSLANLRDPAESLSISSNLSCFAVAPEGSSIICGDESGGVHSILASSSATGSSRSSRRPVRMFDVPEEERHFGTITGISSKRFARSSSHQMSKGFLRGGDGLVLTCGVDWTTKLWAPAYTEKPVMSLLSNTYDYMCDVQWSTVNPSLFAAASSNGTLSLWNLATSLETPISGSDGIKLDEDLSLNKLKWSADGRRLIVTSGDKVRVLGISEDVARPKGDENERMMGNLASRGFLQP